MSMCIHLTLHRNATHGKKVQLSLSTGREGVNILLYILKSDEDMDC